MTTDPQLYGFVVLTRFLEPVEMLDEHLEEHALWIQREYEAGRMLITGPQVPRSGSVMIFVGTDRRALVERLAGEPFHARGLVESQVIQFRPGPLPRRSPEVDAFLRRVGNDVAAV